MKFNKFFLVLLAFALLASAGCHRRPVPDGMPKLYPCLIHVTQGGQPLEGAIVQFASADLADMSNGLPMTVANKWSAAGQTDATGTAKMATRSFNGVSQGDWVVMITKEVVEHDPDNGATYFYSCVSPEYASVTTSPLTLSTATGKTEATFDVEEYKELTRQEGGVAAPTFPGM